MLSEVAHRGSATDKVNGIQQTVDALIQHVERLNDSPRKRAQEADDGQRPSVQC
jgi:hypothetical protein